MRSLTSAPPMNPPAPATSTRSCLSMIPSLRSERLCDVRREAVGGAPGHDRLEAVSDEIDVERAYRVGAGVAAQLRSHLGIVEQLFGGGHPAVEVVRLYREPRPISLDDTRCEVLTRHSGEDRPSGAVVAEDLRWHGEDAGFCLEDHQKCVRRPEHVRELVVRLKAEQ